MSTRKKILISLIIILLLLAAGAYGYGVYYFTSHFLPGSMVNGFNCSYMTVEESEKLLDERIGAYVLAVETRNNGQESISAQDAGLSYKSDGSVNQLVKEQQRFRWFLAFNQHQDYEIPSSIQYDEQKEETAVAALKCMQPENSTEPSDAYIAEKDDKFIIIPEVEGAALDPEKTRQVILDAMLTGKVAVNLEESGCYKKPSVYQNDEMLVKNCEQINKLTDVVITYDFDDRTETVDRETIKNWLKKDKKGNYTLDKKQVTAYVRGLSEKYDTVGNSRTFHTYDGQEITVEGGNYGWQIDQEAEVKALTGLIKEGKTQVREPEYAHEGLSRKTNDIGYT